MLQIPMAHTRNMRHRHAVLVGKYICTQATTPQCHHREQHSHSYMYTGQPSKIEALQPRDDGGGFFLRLALNRRAAQPENPPRWIRQAEARVAEMT